MLEERVYSIYGSKKNSRHQFRDSLNLGLALGFRNIKAKYRQSIFGLFWAILPPVATTFVWVFLTSQDVIKVEKTTIQYPLFVLAGTTTWQLFTQSVIAPLQAVGNNKSILTKINFPRNSVLFAGLVELCVPFAAGIIILIVAFAIFNHLPSLYMILGLVGLIMFMMIGFAIGVFLLPFGILYKDVQYGLPVFMQFLMYLTPVVYPEPVFKGLGSMLDMNPLGPAIDTIRNLLTGCPADTDFRVLLLIGLVLLVLLILAMRLFKITLEVLIERMGT